MSKFERGNDKNSVAICVTKLFIFRMFTNFRIRFVFVTIGGTKQTRGSGRINKGIDFMRTETHLLPKKEQVDGSSKFRQTESINCSPFFVISTILLCAVMEVNS